MAMSYYMFGSICDHLDHCGKSDLYKKIQKITFNGVHMNYLKENIGYLSLILVLNKATYSSNINLILKQALRIVLVTTSPDINLMFQHML